jgi:hypothetical protein
VGKLLFNEDPSVLKQQAKPKKKLWYISWLKELDELIEQGRHYNWAEDE